MELAMWIVGWVLLGAALLITLPHLVVYAIEGFSGESFGCLVSAVIPMIGLAMLLVTGGGPFWLRVVLMIPACLVSVAMVGYLASMYYGVFRSICDWFRRDGE